jgi:hypothetical protein
VPERVEVARVSVMFEWWPQRDSNPCLVAVAFSLRFLMTSGKLLSKESGVTKTRTKESHSRIPVAAEASDISACLAARFRRRLLSSPFLEDCAIDSGVAA